MACKQAYRRCRSECLSSERWPELAGLQLRDFADQSRLSLRLRRPLCSTLPDFLACTSSSACKVARLEGSDKRDSSTSQRRLTDLLADAKTLKHLSPFLSRLRMSSVQRAWPSPEEHPVTTTTWAIAQLYRGLDSVAGFKSL